MKSPTRFCVVSLFVVSMLAVSARGQSAQEPPARQKKQPTQTKELELIQQQRDEVRRALLRQTYQFEAAMNQEREMWQRKWQDLERERRKEFEKQTAPLQAKIKQFELRELSMRRQAEAKENHFVTKIEVRGRLEKHVQPLSIFRLEEEVRVSWQIVCGDVVFKLHFNNAELRKRAESHKGQIVVLTGEAANNHDVVVGGLKAGMN